MDELEKNVMEPEAQPAAPLQDAADSAEAAEAEIAAEAEEIAVEAEEAAAEAEEIAVEAEEAAAEAEDFAVEAEEAAVEAEDLAAAAIVAGTADEEFMTAEAPDAPATMEDELVQELEGIRDMLQQELDKAGDEPLIQELDEIAAETPAPEEIPEEERCQCCGEQRRDTSFGEDYPYCADCRAVMKAAPLRVPAVLLLLFTFLVAGVSLYFTALYIYDYSTLLEGETHYEARELSDAAALLSSYVSQKQGAELAGPTDFADAYSITAVKHLADTFNQMGYLGDANEVLTTYLGEKALQRPWNKKYRAITEDYAGLSETSSAINAIMQDVLYSGMTDIDYDERDEQLQSLLTEQNEDGSPKYDAAFVEFYRYVLLDLQGEKPEKMLEQLQIVQNLDGNAHPWMYLPTMADLASKLGDEEKTKQYVDACLAINTQEATAYKAMANVYRFRDEPDAEKILAVAKDEESHLSGGNSVPTYQELYAIGYLLQEDYEKAMQAMEAYMSYKNSSTGYPAYSVSSCNLYALCSVLCENKEGYDEMASVFASAGMEPSALIKQYQDGKITLTELLQDDGGDF